MLLEKNNLHDVDVANLYQMDVQNFCCGHLNLQIHSISSWLCSMCTQQRYTRRQRGSFKAPPMFRRICLRTGKLADGMDLGPLCWACCLQSFIWLHDEGDGNYHFRFGVWQDAGNLSRVQKRRFSSKGGARTFWESGFSKPVKKSIKDVKSVTLASSDLPRRETTRGTIAYRKNRKLGKPSTHD